MPQERDWFEDEGVKELDELVDGVEDAPHWQGPEEGPAPVWGYTNEEPVEGVRDFEWLEVT